MQQRGNHWRIWFLGIVIQFLTLPLAVQAQENPMELGEEPLLLLGPYQIVLLQNEFTAVLKMEGPNGINLIPAPSGQQFLILDLEFANTGKETYQQIELLMAYTNEKARPLIQQPYEQQPQGTIQKKAPKPGLNIQGKLVFLLPETASNLQLTAIGIQADGQKTAPISAPLNNPEL